MIKQGRLTGAPGAVFASPIAADGNLFFTTEAGAVVVVAPGGDLAVKVVNDLKRRHLRDAGVCRRPHLRAHDAGAVRVWNEVKNAWLISVSALA